MCNFCFSSPYTWETYSTEVLDKCEDWRTSEGPGTMSNNECRFKCCKIFVCSIYERLGQGVRKELPQCVVSQVRNTYPNKNDTDYVDFKKG